MFNRKHLSLLLFFIAVICLNTKNHVFGSESFPAILSKQDSIDIKRIETYLNNIKTLRAKFLQVSSNNTFATGTVLLQRPGKIRFEYDPPSPMMMIADGLFLYVIDKELEEASNLWLGNTPIGFLLDEEIKLSGDIKIIKFSRRANVLLASLVRSEDADAGKITLIFSDKPIELRKWVVTDVKGIKTTVTLDNMRQGLKFNPKLFVFDGFEDNE